MDDVVIKPSPSLDIDFGAPLLLVTGSHGRASRPRKSAGGSINLAGGQGVQPDCVQQHQQHQGCALDGGDGGCTHVEEDHEDGMTFLCVSV